MAVKLYVLLYMHVYRIHNFSFYHLMMTDFPRFTLIMNVVGKMSNYIHQDSKIWNQKIYNYSHFLLFRDVRDLIQILKNSHNLIYLWIYPFTYSRKFNWFLVSCFRYWKKNQVGGIHVYHLVLNFVELISIFNSILSGTTVICCFGFYWNSVTKTCEGKV